MISRIEIDDKPATLFLVLQPLHFPPYKLSHLDVISRSFRSIAPWDQLESNQIQRDIQE